MAEGLSSDYTLTDDCAECDLQEECVTNSCEARFWVAPCGTIDYETGEIDAAAMAVFCEPQPYVIGSITDNATLTEKPRQGCKPFRLRGQPDYSFDITFDICQGSAAHGLLLGRCAFDYVMAPIGNNMNFEDFPSIFDQTTKVFWGRAIGDSASWEFPDKECQTMSRTFLTSGYCWETAIQALNPAL